jgi:hypothetical protein
MGLEGGVKMYKRGDTVYAVDQDSKDRTWSPEGPMVVKEVARRTTGLKYKLGDAPTGEWSSEDNFDRWYPEKDVFGDFGEAIAESIARNFGGKGSS